MLSWSHSRRFELSDRYTLEQIQEFWRSQALQHGQSSAASWTDTPVIEMETREILRFLNDGDRVLDVGCANGSTTVQFAAQKRVEILGLDYIPEMIEQANVRLARKQGQLKGNVSFGVGSILDLQQPAGHYDKVIVIRVVINLGEWANQLRALRECARVLKPGGLLLLSEATLQGWTRLNQFRREWGLPDISMPGFNTYLDQDLVLEATSDQFEVVDVINFASTYYVGTRVLKPLLIEALGVRIDVADPNLEWNRWFSQLPAAGDYGTQKLFVFRKR
jgi:2-polyprenyl-3-methyl-5-hydroxy-6-metoxy-1,4-benzoquinol methylase